MLKKIALGLVLALAVIVALLQYQRTQLEQRVADLLHRQSIQFEQLETQLFPYPSLSLRQFHLLLGSERSKTRSVFGKFLQVDLAWLPLLVGKAKIDQLQLSDGQFEDWGNLNFSLKPTALYVANLPQLQAYWRDGVRDQDHAKWQYRFTLSAQDAQQKRVDMSGHVQLNPNYQLAVEQGELKLRTEGEAKLRLHWQLKQAILNRFGENWFQFSSQSNLLNGQEWGNLVGQLKLSLQQNEFLVQLETKQQLQVNWQANQHWLTVRSQSFPIEKALSAVSLPKLFHGNAMLDLLLWQRKGQQLQGKFNLDIHNGELIGLNFATLASHYLPINYDEQRMSDANTHFDQLQMEWRWLNNQLQLKKLGLRHPEIALSGTGVADLSTRQCDFNLFLASTKADYQKLKLPIHFWGDCTAPQYKVEFNRDLRNQLKDLIKRKFK